MRINSSCSHFTAFSDFSFIWTAIRLHYSVYFFTFCYFVTTFLKFNLNLISWIVSFPFFLAACFQEDDAHVVFFPVYCLLFACRRCCKTLVILVALCSPTISRCLLLVGASAGHDWEHSVWQLWPQDQLHYRYLWDENRRSEEGKKKYQPGSTLIRPLPSYKRLQVKICQKNLANILGNHSFQRKYLKKLGNNKKVSWSIYWPKVTALAMWCGIEGLIVKLYIKKHICLLLQWAPMYHIHIRFISCHKRWTISFIVSLWHWTDHSNGGHLLSCG